MRPFIDVFVCDGSNNSFDSQGETDVAGCYPLASATCLSLSSKRALRVSGSCAIVIAVTIIPVFERIGWNEDEAAVMVAMLRDQTSIEDWL